MHELGDIREKVKGIEGHWSTQAGLVVFCVDLEEAHERLGVFFQKKYHNE